MLETIYVYRSHCRNTGHNMVDEVVKCVKYNFAKANRENTESFIKILEVTFYLCAYLFIFYFYERGEERYLQKPPFFKARTLSELLRK